MPIYECLQELNQGIRFLWMGDDSFESYKNMHKNYLYYRDYYLNNSKYDEYECYKNNPVLVSKKNQVIPQEN